MKDPSDSKILSFGQTTFCRNRTPFVPSHQIVEPESQLELDIHTQGRHTNHPDLTYRSSAWTVEGNRMTTFELSCEMDFEVQTLRSVEERVTVLVIVESKQRFR